MVRLCTENVKYDFTNEFPKIIGPLLSSKPVEELIRLLRLVNKTIRKRVQLVVHKHIQLCLDILWLAVHH